MAPDTQGVLVAITGVIAIRLVVSDTFLAYVKPGMRIPLLIAGIIMTVLGAVTAFKAMRAGRTTEPPVDVAGGAADAHEVHDDGPGPSHSHGAPPVAWLLLLPLLAVLLVAPAPLGSYAAARSDPREVVIRTEPASSYPPLAAPREGAVDLTIGEFLERVYYDDSGSLEGTPVRLTGFVVKIPERPDAYFLTRFVISCCAADAFAMQAIVATDDIPANDTWLEVVGTWDPDDEGLEQAGRTATLQPTAVRPVEPPANPYE
ncbi:MAG: TIGR03943 family putative permease subunit [Acidimicrobiales bacterium]